MLIFQRPQTDPYFNLAAEEFILKHYEDNSFMLWRNEPAIIVGKHQNTLAEVNMEYVHDHQLKVVRRISGGGAVFHDLGNINFTFIRQGEQGSLVDFRKFTEPILEVMAGLGIEARFEGRNDLTIGGRKFSGNAEHVYKNRVLHHGTLLYSSIMDQLANALKVDPSKFTDKAVKSVRSRVTNITEHMKEPLPIDAFMGRIQEHILKTFTDCHIRELGPDDISGINKLVKEKYETWEWNFGYSPNYNFSKKVKTTNGGTIEMNIQATAGIISEVRIFGDYFSSRDTSELEALLVGYPHQMEAIQSLAGTIQPSDYFSKVTEEEFVSLFF